MKSISMEVCIKNILMQKGMIKAGYDIKFIKQLFRHHDITITDMYMSSFNPIVDEKLLANYPTM